MWGRGRWGVGGGGVGRGGEGNGGGGVGWEAGWVWGASVAVLWGGGSVWNVGAGVRKGFLVHRSSKMQTIVGPMAEGVQAVVGCRQGGWGYRQCPNK